MHVLRWLRLHSVLALPSSSACLLVTTPVPQFILPHSDSSTLYCSYGLYPYYSILIPYFNCMSYSACGYMDSYSVTIILHTPLNDHSNTPVSCYVIFKCQPFGSPCFVCPSVTHTILTYPIMTSNACGLGSCCMLHLHLQGLNSC